MNNDLIRRSDAINALVDYMYEVALLKADYMYDALLKADGTLKTREHYTRYAEAIIRHIPSADRPQGEWIDKGDYAECSNCGANSGTQYDGVEPVPRKTKFCPNCGTRMKGADDDSNSK